VRSEQEQALYNPKMAKTFSKSFVGVPKEMKGQS
jgi:hypothetical protein